ncbi:MAG: pinensin family lanthipeptide [Cyclobacteriaceae bacterium]
MKKQRLNLAQLKVQSFVTDMDSTTTETAKGGRIHTLNEVCASIPPYDDGCNYHTAQAHQCSDAACYSDYCHLTYPASDRCAPV